MIEEVTNEMEKKGVENKGVQIPKAAHPRDTGVTPPAKRNPPPTPPPVFRCLECKFTRVEKPGLVCPGCVKELCSEAEEARKIRENAGSPGGRRLRIDLSGSREVTPAKAEGVWKAAEAVWNRGKVADAAAAAAATTGVGRGSPRAAPVKRDPRWMHGLSGSALGRTMCCPT